MSHEPVRQFQGGMSNDELRAAFKSKLPNVEPTERDLTMFALGVEVGAAKDAIEWEWYRLEGIGMVRRRKAIAGEDSSYVCPQCGPDPRGASAHAKAMHEWPHDDPPDCAPGCHDLDPDQGMCRKCFASMPQSNGGPNG